MFRGEANRIDSDLEVSSRAVIDRLNELRDDPKRVAALEDEEKRRLLIAVDARRRLVFRQRAIEDWVADWAPGQATAAG